MRKKPGSTSIVRDPERRNLGASDSIQALHPELRGGVRGQNSPPTMPAVEEIVTTRPARWARMTGRVARVTLTGPNRVVSICGPELLRAELLEEPGVEVPGVVDQHVDPTEPVHGQLDGRLGARRGR